MTTTTTPSRSEARTISIRMLSQLHGFLAGRLTAAQLAKHLKKLAADIEASAVAKPKPADEPPSAVQELFAYWQGRMVKPKAKLTADRKRVIQARIREGYTVEVLKAAIDGCAASPFHAGENERGTAYNDLTLIFRNGSKVEHFAEMAKDQGTTVENPELDRLKAEQAEALARGDVDAYNHANARIRDLTNAAAGRTTH